MIVKYYGIVDIIAAALIFTMDFGNYNIIKLLLIGTLLFKGLPSLFS